MGLTCCGKAKGSQSEPCGDWALTETAARWYFEGVKGELMRSTLIFTFVAVAGLLAGCEQNGNVRVASQPVLLSNPPETSLTSTGTLNTSTQEVREAMLAVAKELQMPVLQAPPPGVEGEALLGSPSGNAIRVHYKEIA